MEEKIEHKYLEMLLRRYRKIKRGDEGDNREGQTDCPIGAQESYKRKNCGYGVKKGMYKQ